MQKIFQAAAENPLMIPPDLMSYILDYVQTSRLIIPIGQVFGFSQFTAIPATEIVTSESTASTSFVDLTTAGPSLSGLSDGKYVFFFGGSAFTTSATGDAFIGLNVNGTVGDNDFCAWQGDALCSISKAVVASINNGGGSTVKLQYSASSGVTASFLRRWLIALKYGNL